MHLPTISDEQYERLESFPPQIRYQDKEQYVLIGHANEYTCMHNKRIWARIAGTAAGAYRCRLRDNGGEKLTTSRIYTGPLDRGRVRLGDVLMPLIPAEYLPAHPPEAMTILMNLMRAVVKQTLNGQTVDTAAALKNVYRRFGASENDVEEDSDDQLHLVDSPNVLGMTGDWVSKFKQSYIKPVHLESSEDSDSEPDKTIRRVGRGRPKKGSTSKHRQLRSQITPTWKADAAKKQEQVDKDRTGKRKRRAALPNEPANHTNLRKRPPPNVEAISQEPSNSPNEQLQADEDRSAYKKFMEQRTARAHKDEGVLHLYEVHKRYTSELLEAKEKYASLAVLLGEHLKVCARSVDSVVEQATLKD